MATEESGKLVELDVDQLINFISSISQFGCETNKIKLDFDLYSQEILDRFPTNDHFIREQLRKIPAVIRSSLDPGTKMITMHKYNTAIIQFILNDIINQKHAQFFKVKESKETKVLIKKLLRKRKAKAKAEDEIDLENYEHKLTAQQDQTERMAILALSLSIEERIAFLEQHQVELSHEVCEKIYDALKISGIFNELKDINGNPLVMDEQMQRHIIQTITNQYIDGFVEFSMQRQIMDFDAARNFPEQDPPILHVYANNGNNLFEEYHRHIEHQMHAKVHSALQDRNLSVDRPGAQGLGNHFHKEIKNNKGAMMEIANERREVIEKQSVLQNINAKNIKSDRRQNRFSAP